MGGIELREILGQTFTIFESNSWETFAEKMDKKEIFHIWETNQIQKVGIKEAHDKPFLECHTTFNKNLKIIIWNKVEWIRDSWKELKTDQQVLRK